MHMAQRYAFDCVRCARCCVFSRRVVRDVVKKIKVPVNEAEVGAIVEFAKIEDPATVFNVYGGQYYLGHDEKDRCVFLDKESNNCTIYDGNVFVCVLKTN